jgi:TonB family protein
MRRLLTISCLLLFSGSGYSVIAQQASPWIDFEPADRLFHVSMPREPKGESVSETNADLHVEGSWWTAGTGDASYAIWSLVDPRYRKGQDLDSYLDSVAELFWEALLKPARDNLPADRRAYARMTYGKSLSRDALTGREYSLSLGDLTGTADLYVAEGRAIVLLAMDLPAAVWEREKFLGSVSFSANLTPIPGYEKLTSIGAGVSEGHATVGEQPFRTSEVNQRPQIIDKPEPSYTESARKFGVTGTVILRAVFSQNGEVTNIYILRRLPHGLTQRALDAARSIKFSPAIKDGKPVSMYMQLEYNFNLY